MPTNRSLTMLSRCNEVLIRQDDEPRLLEEVCRLAVDVGGYRMAWVGHAQDGPDKLIVPMAYAPFIRYVGPKLARSCVLP